MDKTLEEPTIAAILNNYAYPKGFVMKLRSLLKFTLLTASLSSLVGCFDDSPAGGTIGVNSSGSSQDIVAIGDLEELDDLFGGTKWETDCRSGFSEVDGSFTYVIYTIDFSSDGLEFDDEKLEYGPDNETCEGQYIERSNGQYLVSSAYLFSSNSIDIYAVLDRDSGPKEWPESVYYYFSKSDDVMYAGVPWSSSTITYNRATISL